MRIGDREGLGGVGGVGSVNLVGVAVFLRLVSTAAATCVNSSCLNQLHCVQASGARLQILTRSSTEPGRTAVT